MSAGDTALRAADTDSGDLLLVSHHLCPYVQRAVITLTEKGIAHRRVYIDLADKPDWFREISPLGKVPLLRTADTVLFESAVICEYLDETTPGSLHPAEAVRRAAHRAWIELASATLDAIAGFYNAPDHETFRTRTTVLRDRLAWLEARLEAGPYFDGDRFSLVDAAWAPVLRYFETFDQLGDFGLMNRLDRVRAYRNALAARESVVHAVPAGYPGRLQAFISRRGGYLSRFVPDD